MSSAEAEAQAALADAQLVASEIERLQAANQRLMAENWQLRQLRQKLETAPSDPSSSLKAEQRRSTVLENGAVFNNYFTGPRRFLVLEIKPHCQRG